MSWRSGACTLARVLCACTFSGVLACGGADAGGTPPLHDAGGERPWAPPAVDYPDAKSTETFRLSQTGLYRDIRTKELAPDLIDYEPEYVLWSDGAEKSRWLRLPEDGKVDTSDMDHWVFPIGTTFFKEFKRDGKRVETRVVARLGPDPDDYFMGAFVWNDDETDAVFARGGEPNARGTDHDVPEVKRCFTCHNGDRGRVLGYSAVQQPMAAAPLSDPPARPFVVPGDEVARRALGYLHANCGNCHNPNGTSRTDTNLTLRLSVGEHGVEDTATFKSTVGVELDHWLQKGFELRIAAGEPERSAVLVRMRTREKDDAMPPFASEIPDADGIATVEKWIASLPIPGTIR